MRAVSAIWLVAYLLGDAAVSTGGLDPGFAAAVVPAVLSFIAAIACAVIQVHHSRKKDTPTGDSTLVVVLEALHDAEVEAANARREADEARADRDEQAELVKHLYSELEHDRGDERLEDDDHGVE